MAFVKVVSDPHLRKSVVNIECLSFWPLNTTQNGFWKHFFTLFCVICCPTFVKFSVFSYSLPMKRNGWKGPTFESLTSPCFYILWDLSSTPFDTVLMSPKFIFIQLCLVLNIQVYLAFLLVCSRGITNLVCPP